MTDLIEFVDRYIAARDNSVTYSKNIRKRAAKLAAFVGSPRITDTLTEERVNAFLASLSGLSPFTVRSYRSDLLAIWNSAADCDFVPYPMMRRIRKPKCPALMIDCYSVAEVRAILEQSRKCHKYIMRTGVDRRVYWPAVIQLAWDTGLRRGDVWAFRKRWIRPDGSARVVQEKTGQAITVRLFPSTIAALDAIPFDRACHWPGALSNSPRFSRQFNEMARAAGVTRGTFKWIRRASGSYVELAKPGAGSKHLGHSSPQVFGQHYDARLVGHTAPMPPTIGGPAVMPVAQDPASDPLDEFAFL